MEQPDVHLEDAEEEQEVDEPMETNENTAPNGQINGMFDALAKKYVCRFGNCR